jgi:porin
MGTFNWLEKSTEINQMKVNLEFRLSMLLLFFLSGMGDCFAQDLGDPQTMFAPTAIQSQTEQVNRNQPSVSSDPLGAPQTSGIYQDIPQFGGPLSVSGQLTEDYSVGPQFRWQGLQEHFDPWFQFKERVNERRGFQFAVDDSMFYQVATQSLGESDGASGLVRFYGQWELPKCRSRNPGMLVYKIENRHRIGTITPFELGFEAGSIVPTGTFFNAFDFGVTNLFWKQYLFDEKLAVAIGKIDVSDYVDPYAMMNPLTHFINLSFSTNPTIAIPNQGLGVAAGGMLTEKLYFQAGFADANGQATRSGFDTFFDDNEYFSYAELGFTSSKDRIYLDNVHLTLWNTDARVAAGTPSGWGVAFTAQKYITESWLPFFRFGYSDGDAALLQTVFSTGIGYKRKNNDVAGLGLSWGKPADGSLRDQFTSEAFYRFQLTQSLAITPDVQLVVDPALNPDEDVLAFFGIRMRAAF